jgi:hypothetical protein
VFDREALRNMSKETWGTGRLPLHCGKRHFFVCGFCWFAVVFPVARVGAVILED